jgi:MoxR-like ATPase
VTGLNYFDQSKSRFVFRPGPVFSNILLADEINRATPRTQSALLECMAERQVTVDGTTRILEDPFFVIATQNPVETLGTFPLPEAQLDRFFMQISMGKMSEEEELQMIDRFMEEEPLAHLGACCGKDEILALRQECRRIFVHPDLRRYITRLVQNTRTLSESAGAGAFPDAMPRIEDGVSPRGTLALVRAAQGYALLQGRDFVTPEDIQACALPTLSHRCLSSGISSAREKEDRIRSALTQTEVPTEDWKRTLL